MKRVRLLILALPALLAACQSISDRDTIGRLRNQQIQIENVKIEGGLEKAMQSYQHFLQETPNSALAPEAIRRLADLKIEKEYGTITEGDQPAKRAPSAATSAPEHVQAPDLLTTKGKQSVVPAGAKGESDTEFEKRATRSQPVAGTAAGGSKEGADDLERADTLEAIALYKKLLKKYPLYPRNDQVLYQMSRAYAELGQTEKAMAVMNRMVREFPRSRYIDEVQFRRAEYFFTRKHFLDAEDAYSSIVKIGVGSPYYELALYKLGWTFYKQELYEEALHRFIALLDHKVAVGYDFAQTHDEQARKRIEDTFRVISLSFSNLGGAKSVVEYFAHNGKRSYEDGVYSHLGEFYFDKRRFADAASTYNAFVSRNPFHKMAPNFQMRVIEIDAAGGFPSLVLEAKKSFATTYGLKAEYWKHFEPSARPDVLGFLKTNLTDLAHYYHAGYQDPHQADKKAANFKEALHWYREFLTSFPKGPESPAINFQLADLLMENHSFGQAAVEYEKTAYNYPQHAKSSQAGYAAVYAYRQQLAAAAPGDRGRIKREVVRSSLKFADTFPQHKKAPYVLGAATDDLYDMKDYPQALKAANKLLWVFPGADPDVVRAAWLVIGHSSYELQCYSDAEAAYLKVLDLLPPDDKTHDTLVDNLAASIYKQGEQARDEKDYRAAADHFLRVGRLAPSSTILPTAEYDAAAALIQLKDWKTAASVLLKFRADFPGHKLQPEVTKKIAYVYKESGQFSLAADEYERIEKESGDAEIRREALQVAAELHVKAGDNLHALEVYRRYVDEFPQPVEANLETRNKIAAILKARSERKAYLDELEQIVAIEGAAGDAQTPRTRTIAAEAALVLAEREYDAFAAVKLEKPFKVNLRKKRNLMKAAIQEFDKLVNYEIGDITAAATYYLAEIYANFSKSLTTSERPEGMSPMELEQYNLAIEDQAYPFEEKAIAVHESNLKLISRGVYNEWIDKSLQKLAVLMPARYNKPEEDSGIIDSPDTYVFEIKLPAAAPSPKETVAKKAEPASPAAQNKTTTKNAEPAAPATQDQTAAKSAESAASATQAKTAAKSAESVAPATQAKTAGKSAEPAAPATQDRTAGRKDESAAPATPDQTAGKKAEPASPAGQNKTTTKNAEPAAPATQDQTAGKKDESAAPEAQDKTTTKKAEPASPATQDQTAAEKAEPAASPSRDKTPEKNTKPSVPAIQEKATEKVEPAAPATQDKTTAKNAGSDVPAPGKPSEQVGKTVSSPATMHTENPPEVERKARPAENQDRSTPPPAGGEAEKEHQAAGR